MCVKMYLIFVNFYVAVLLTIQLCVLVLIQQVYRFVFLNSDFKLCLRYDLKSFIPKPLIV